MNKKFKQIFALMILLSFIVAPTYAVIAGTNASGNYTGHGTSTGGKLQAPGVLIGIRRVDNNISDSDYIKAVPTQSKRDVMGKVGYYLTKNYLKNAPPSVKDSSIVSKYALVTRGDANYNFSDRNNQLVYGADLVTKNTFNNVYEVNRLSDYVEYTPLLLNDLQSSTYKKSFTGKTMTFDTLNKIIKDNGITKSIAGNKIAKALADTQYAYKIYAYKTPSANPGMTEDECYLYNDARYLDDLVMVNEMCGGVFDEYIKGYLSERNSDSAKYFYIIDMITVVGMKDSSTSDMKWYSYPSFMATMTGKDISKYMNTSSANHKSGDEYRSDVAKFIDIDKDWEKTITDSVSNYTLKNVWDWAWYDQWKARYSLMPRDLNSKQTWGSGYSFITNSYCKANPDPSGKVKVYVEPASATVKSGDKVSASIKIALTSDATSIESNREIFAEYRDKYGIYPKVTIQLGFNNSVGSGTSAKAYDVMTTTNGWVFNSSTMKITKTFDTWASLKEYLDGTSGIKLIDNDITITTKTRNWYTAKANLYWAVDKQADFAGNGTDTKYTKNKVPNTGGDSVAWFLDPVNPDTGFYYSSPRKAYVEIKEGSPSTERFEAMAGVPTTEDLYVGFGATEFVSNLEVAKKDAPASTRTYKINYICTQCTELNEKCIISSTTHTHTHVTGYTEKGVPISQQFSWVCGGSCGFCGGTNCPGDTHPGTWKTGTVGVGCQYTEKINQDHPHSITITGTITQPIAAFTYTGIKGFDLWQLNRAILVGNTSLFSNPNQTINPNTGYKIYQGQTGYTAGNGRLVFSNGFVDTDKYGNTTITYTDTRMMTHAECDTAATSYMNNLISTMKVKATVVSDYAVLTTTEGYQSLMYHEYDSDTVNVATARFTTGSDNKSITGDTITFTTKPTWSQFWTTNTNSAGTWTADRITRSGYNGNYADYNSKWNNANIVTADPSAKWTNFPNLNQLNGDTAFASGFANTRLTRTGLNIIDSTSSSNTWSDSDGIDPISNGIYDTGHCYIEYDKAITIGSTSGEDYATDGTMHREEVGYSPNHMEVNDIVIHDPVSAQYATVQSNDKKYDQRTATSLAEGGDPHTASTDKCPRDASCEYSKLTCTIAPTQHTEACYTQVETGYQHVGGLNAHVHTGNSTTGGGCYTTPVYHTHTGSPTTGGGCYTVPNYHQHTDSCYTNGPDPIVSFTDGSSYGVSFLSGGNLFYNCNSNFVFGQSSWPNLKQSNVSNVKQMLSYGGMDDNFYYVLKNDGSLYQLIYGTSQLVTTNVKEIANYTSSSSVRGITILYNDGTVRLGPYGVTSKDLGITEEILHVYNSGGSASVFITENRLYVAVESYPSIEYLDNYFGFTLDKIGYSTGYDHLYSRELPCSGKDIKRVSTYLSKGYYSSVTNIAILDTEGRVHIIGDLGDGSRVTNWKQLCTNAVDINFSCSLGEVMVLATDGYIYGYYHVDAGSNLAYTYSTYVGKEYNRLNWTNGNAIFITSDSGAKTKLYGGVPYAAPSLTTSIISSGSFIYTPVILDKVELNLTSRVLSCGKTTSTVESYTTGCGKTTSTVQSWSLGCTNTPNTHICTSQCGVTTENILTCEDPHHYKAGEPWDYNDPNNHYDFGDLRCYTPCMDGDVIPEDFTLYSPIASVEQTEYGSAIKFAKSTYQGANAKATNIFTKDDTYVVSFDAWSTVDGDKVQVDAFPDTLPETTVTLTTQKKNYVWSLSSSHTDMNMASLRFFPSGVGTNGDVYITNIQVGKCANTSVGHVHSANCIISKHKSNGNVVKDDGTVLQVNDIFINIDREFKVYFPNVGDFAQQPNLHGISECSTSLGMGYTDGMDTTEWTREKYVTLPVNVIDANGKSHYAGERISLLTLPNVNNTYTFYAVLANSEAVNAGNTFLAVSRNAPEIAGIDDSTGETNRERNYSYTAAHSGSKYQVIDVLGYIGSLALNDTGDFRFATLFKQKTNDGTWLIPNLVPSVNYKLPNKVLTDKLDVRQETASPSTLWHSTYGVTTAETGGKAFESVNLPLTPAKNPIVALQNQPLRPGYKLYMDVETVGNYYGENYDANMNSLDNDLYYKMQITPRYWQLMLDSGEYIPVDAYMGKKNEYKPVVMFNDASKNSEWIYYLDWLEESARRNYTANEKAATNAVSTDFSFDIPAQVIEGQTIPGFKQRVRTPITTKDPIGTANRIFLNDLNRTFIGSSKTYGVSKNADNLWAETYFARQSQRWHWSLGLPSSVVFVEAGKECNTDNINEVKNRSQSVIVCSIDIKVKGQIWTLEYDGTAINTSDGTGIQITPGGRTYEPPTDPVTSLPLTDPIVAVYSAEYTSKDDLKTEGTH